jgi:hypothetical protein
VRASLLTRRGLALQVLVVLVFGRSAAAQSLQEIVDRFYPAETLHVDSPDERRSCFAIYQSDAAGPTTVIAGYSDMSRGMVRVLSRSASGAFAVAAESPRSLLMLGNHCEVALENVEGDRADEILFTLTVGVDSVMWILRWTGTNLENRTPTEPDEGSTVVSALVNATILDLAHDGGRQVYVNHASVRLDEPQVQANQLFTSGAAGFVFNRDVVAAARFVVQHPGELDWTTFRAIAKRPGPYTLRIVNGAPTGLGRVTGGTIELNDVTIVGPGQLGSGVEFLTVPVNATLTDINRLDIDLTGEAGSFVTIVIDFPPAP